MSSLYLPWHIFLLLIIFEQYNAQAGVRLCRSQPRKTGFLTLRPTCNLCSWAKMDVLVMLLVCAYFKYSTYLYNVKERVQRGTPRDIHSLVPIIPWNFFFCKTSFLDKRKPTVLQEQNIKFSVYYAPFSKNCFCSMYPKLLKHVPFFIAWELHQYAVFPKSWGERESVDNQKQALTKSTHHCS